MKVALRVCLIYLFHFHGHFGALDSFDFFGIPSIWNVRGGFCFPYTLIRDYRELTADLHAPSAIRILFYNPRDVSMALDH